MVLCFTTLQLLLVRSKGNFSFLSALVAKAFCFVLIFLILKAKSKRFGRLYKYTKTFRFSPKVLITFRFCWHTFCCILLALLNCAILAFPSAQLLRLSESHLHKLAKKYIKITAAFRLHIPFATFYFYKKGALMLPI